MDKPTEFLTLQSLALKLGINYQRAQALHDAGVLNHDSFSSHFFMFRADRVPELREVVKNYGLAKATAHRQSQLRKS
jgi:hypothetical protein